jgi:hypothetical protein
MFKQTNKNKKDNKLKNMRLPYARACVVQKKTLTKYGKSATNQESFLKKTTPSVRLKKQTNKKTTN